MAVSNATEFGSGIHGSSQMAYMGWDCKWVIGKAELNLPLLKKKELFSRVLIMRSDYKVII